MNANKKVTINYQSGDKPAYGWDKELIIAQQEKAFTREQFWIAMKLNQPDIEEKRRILMKISVRVQDIKTMLYFDKIYPGKTMNEIIQIINKIK